jgi:alkylation response protein AidB-like acyl-CoA dehydrogenase
MDGSAGIETGDTSGLTARILLDRMTPDEIERARLVESVLPALADAAVEADLTATFPMSHVETLSRAGLLGLVVPEAYGGLGGGLRDLTGATFAMGTVCPSTALAFFFHNSSASRGLLPLEAVEAGLFEEAQAKEVTAFSERLLTRLGTDGRWMANFASESAKSSTANISISTSAEPATRDGVEGWLLNGVKSFGCATGVADDYLVTAKFPGGDTADFLGVFMVDRLAEGVGERTKWDAIGMRSTATHGITLEDVFVPSDAALAIEGAFTKMMQMSRGSFVGSQLAGTAVYLGAALASYRFATEHLRNTTFADTGEPIGTAPFQQQLLGEMTEQFETARLWLARQLELETTDEPLMDKTDVVRQWRVAKGSVAESAFAVGQKALTACGTSNTGNSGLIARMLRDLSMGLVQAFPAEKGRMEAATTIVKGSESTQFAAAKKPEAG